LHEPAAQLSNLTYTYDANGHRLSMDGSLAAVTLPANVAGGCSTVYNADNEQTSFNGASQTFDADGNLTNDGTNTYGWNSRNQLATISGGATASFLYDGVGRRQTKIINSKTTQFLYVGLNPLQELDGSTPPTVTANLLDGLNIDEYFTRIDSSGNVSTLITDALGSTVGLAGPAGTIATSYTYQPFGATTSAGTSDSNSYQFTGRENDGTGLYYYRARYYSPLLSRLISQDPIELLRLEHPIVGGTFAIPTKLRLNNVVGPKSDSRNLFIYSLDNPVNFKDPSGLDVWCHYYAFGGYYLCFSTDGSAPAGVYQFRCPGLLNGMNCSNGRLTDECHFTDAQFNNLLFLEKKCGNYSCS